MSQADPVSKKRSSAEISAGAEAGPKSSAPEKTNATGLPLTDDFMQLGMKMTSMQKKTINKIAVAQGPASQILCVITNDVGYNKKKMVENGHNELFIVKACVVAVLSPGYLNSPYEPSAHVPKNSRSFTDKDGKPMPEFKPQILTQVQKGAVTEGAVSTDVMIFKSFNSHPKPALNTKCRGLPTEEVGCIYPGLSLNFTAYGDNCKISAVGGPADGREEKTGVDLIQQYSVAIIGVKPKGVDKCDRGYGLALYSIQVLNDVDVSMEGIFPVFNAYTPYSPIGTQTDALMQTKKFSKCMPSDLHFIRNFFRQQDKPEAVNESPIVTTECTRIGNDTKVHVSSSNSSLQLVLDDEKSIYHMKTMDVFIPPQAFTTRTRTGGLVWLQQLYSWLLAARVASVRVVHDDYRFNQPDSGSGRGLGCFVVPDFARFCPKGTASTDSVSFTPAQVEALMDKANGGINIKQTLENGSLRYAAWTVHAEGSKKFVVIGDNTGIRYAKPVSGGESEHECNSSPFAQVYPGMSPARGVYMSYLVVMNSSAILSVTVVGLQEVKCSSASDVSASSLIAIPDVVADIDSIFG